ncbi:alkaline phosphatase family protein, partial [bacterium]|nr:alkaline phosphatase family protein [candidate division CSSED10-310 bacterium]
MLKRWCFIGICLIFMACSNESGIQDQLIQLHEESPAARVLIIGFDGATWDMFLPAMEQGKMPVLQDLITRGVRAALETIKPTLTPVIWTTIATGKLPEQHGVQSVVDRDPVSGRMLPVSSGTVRVKTMWDVVGDHGKDATIVRWPVTWPASPISGEIVTDYAFQSGRLHRAYPDELSSLVDSRRVSAHLPDIRALTGVTEAMYDRMAPVWQWKLMVLLREYALDVQYKDIARTLFETRQRDLTTVYFYSLDALGHNFYKFVSGSPEGDEPDFREMVMNWCWLYDQFLGEILQSIDPKTYVFVCSDHGMEQAMTPQNFLVRAENQPPIVGETAEEMSVPPAPPYDADPFSVKLQYTLPSGQHVNKPDGIFVLSGPRTKVDWQAPRVHATEIAPTVFYLLDIPVAADLAGTVRLDLFDPDFIRSHPVKKTAT